MGLVRAWLTAFLMTVAIETPIVAWVYRQTEPRLARRLVLIFFANLATHPAVWFVFTKLPYSYGRQVLLAEIWAFGLEIVFYAFAFAGGPRRAVLASVAANGASLAFGYLWLALGGHF